MGQPVQGVVGHLLTLEAQREMGQRIRVVTVTPLLGDQELRLESVQGGRHDGIERPQPVVVGRTRRQGDVDGGALRTLAADLGGPPGPGEQRAGAFVDRDGQHPRVVPEVLLDPVAVVDVDVDVGDPLHTLVEQPLDTHREVVVDTEPGGPVRHRMVQATGEVHPVVRLTPVDRLCDRQGRGTHTFRVLMHVGERGDVVRTQTMTAGRLLLNGRHELRRVHAV